MEQEPPIIEKIFIQKLQTLGSAGENLIVYFHYNPHIEMPDELELFADTTHTLYLNDKGIYPDSVAGDYVYSFLVKTDIDSLLSDILTRELLFFSDGGTIDYLGRDGQFVSANEGLRFDLEAFNIFKPVQVYQPILNTAICGTAIKKHHSLFITDLSVVEDPARTFNIITQQGNPQGAWTFGTLLKNIANQAYTGISAKQFIKTWLKTWTHEQFSGNHLVLERMPKIMMHVIAPWMQKANSVNNNVNLPPIPIDNDVNMTDLAPWLALDPLNPNDTSAQWEDWWDAIDEQSLLTYAPFKLTAIVNRIDLRASTVYTKKIKNAGETKTNFTMVLPRGYGEEANYWNAIPTYETKVINTTLKATLDDRFNQVDQNPGTTFERSTQTHELNHDMVEKTQNEWNQIVSPFLTGRRYSSATANHWQDDELHDLAIEAQLNSNLTNSFLADNLLTGLYYVNDPSNESQSITIYPQGLGGNYPQLHYQRWGFNDLDRRQKDLCDLIRLPCGVADGGVVPIFSIMRRALFLPLPLKGH